MFARVVRSRYLVSFYMLYVLLNVRDKTHYMVPAYKRFSYIVNQEIFVYQNIPVLNVHVIKFSWVPHKIISN